MVLTGCLVLAALSTTCTPASRPLLAEVLYDAIGDDTGHEFVELLNPGAAPCALAGLRVEAGDGSAPGRWTLRWTGGIADTIRAGARFVIGGAAVTPRPDAIVSLDLQNGPDAVRLVWPDGATAVLGWGTHEFAEYACGEPAPDVASGQSLARTPDDSDAGANALDFRPATPSPGAANVSTRNVAVAPGTLRVTPVTPAPGAPITITGGLMNLGREAIEARAVTIAALAARDGGPREPLVAAIFPPGLAAGDSLGFTIEAIAPAAGKVRIVVQAQLAGDQNAADDADSLHARIGPCPLALSEIQFHPAAGEGEWVEVRNVSGGAVDLAGFTLSDRTGTAGKPEAGAALAPESLAVLAQDRTALLFRFPALDSTRVREARPWPSLNNRDDETGAADEVRLRELDGTPCDGYAYSATGLTDGVTLEWRDGGWWPARSADGSPLALPRGFAAPSGRFVMEPRLLRPGASVVRCRWALPWPRARVRLEVLDLAGRRLPGGVAEFVAPALGEKDVSFPGLPPGLYAVALRARPEGGSEEISELRPLRILGGAP